MELDEFVDGLDFPMFIVTTAHEGERSGCLVGFGTQVSIDPALFLVCLSKVNHTHGVALDADHLAVHLLRPDQRELAELFGAETGDEVDKFERCAWQPGPGGVPVLDDCPRVLVGRVQDRLDVLGDHTGFVLAPVVQDSRPGDPGLTFHQVRDIDPGHPA